MHTTFQLIRFETGAHGTLGKIIAPDIQCYSIELPWKNNEQNISCIIAGAYPYRKEIHPKFGRCLRLFAISEREGVLMHAGSFAGDVSLGWKSDSSGCVIIGSKIEKIKKQKAAINSRATLDTLILSLPEKGSVDIKWQ
jgi:hypothetical protein